MHSTQKLLAILVTVAVISIALLPLCTLYLIQPEYTSLIERLNEEEADRIAAFMAWELVGEEGHLSVDGPYDPFISSYLTTHSKELNLGRIQVLSTSGKVLYSTRAGEEGTTIALEGDFSESLREKHPHIRTVEIVESDDAAAEDDGLSAYVEATVPLLRDGTVIGAMRINYDVTARSQTLRSILSRTNLVLIIATALVLYVIYKTTWVAKGNLKEKSLAEKALSDSEVRYRSLVESTDDSIYLVDRDCRYMFMNLKHRVRLGISGDDYAGTPFAEYHSAEEAEWFTRAVREVVETKRTTYHEHRSKRAGMYFMLTMNPIYDDKGSVGAVNVISKNITDRKRMEEELRALTLTDESTGLSNRRGFFTLAAQQMKIAERSRVGFHLISVHVDNLMEINEKLGFAEGGMVLTDTASVLTEGFRGADIIARIDSDEFVILPVECAGDCIDTIIDRISDGIASKNANRSPDDRFTVSIGTAYYEPDEACTLEDLLLYAYKDMEAKRDA